MKYRALTLILFAISSHSFGDEIAIKEVTESCLYDIQKKYSSQWTFGKFEALVTDAGGYGAYKSFILPVIAPYKGKIIYKEGKLSTTSEKFNTFIEEIVVECGSAVNKSKHADMVKLSPFLCTQKSRQLHHAGV